MKWLGVVICALICLMGTAMAETIRIAAAGNLQFVLPEIIKQYPHKKHRIDITYASSGKLFAQISKGAPYHIYLSANEKFPNKLAASMPLISAPYVYATGNIAVWSLTKDICDGLTEDILSDLSHFVIPNPVYAPYGKAGMEWIVSADLDEPLSKKIVYAENLPQTVHYVKSGVADAAIIAYSQYKAPLLNGTGYLYLPEDNQYEPVKQAMVLLSDSAAVQSVYDFIRSDIAKSLFTSFGYGVNQ